MKRWLRALFCVALSLMCLFTCAGYAVLSTSMSVVGAISVTMPEGVYITGVKKISTSNISDNECTYISSTTNLENRIRKQDGAAQGVVVYEVTVYNNTRISYYYRDIYFQTGLSEYNGNDYIANTQESDNVTVSCAFDNGAEEDKKLYAGQSKIFQITYTVGEDIGADVDLNMLVNIRFGIHVSGEREAIDMIEGRFLEILNTPYTYHYLIDVLDNKYDGENDWTSNYVGNVAGAYEGAFSDDSVAVNTLFQSRLQMTIDGELREATVIIKHENIDWLEDTGDDYEVIKSNGEVKTFRGCEMTLYLTIDPLDMPNSVATVYAMVFTCDTDWGTGQKGDWYRTGDTFVGKAPIVDYVTGLYGTGSFQTTGWVPDLITYEVLEGYHFEIKSGNKVETFHIDSFSYSVLPVDRNYMYYLLETVSNDAPYIILQLLDDAWRILENRNYAGEGINHLRAVYEKYYWVYGYTGQAFTYWPYNTLRKFYPAMTDLYEAIDSVLSDISELA